MNLLFLTITLPSMLMWIGIAALVLTAGVGFLYKSHKSWLMTFLQNYCGALFIFSGWVKAVDPLGTAYKMEQYFDEFYSTFEGTWFGFIAPLFPVFSKYAIWFSLFMIILEIVLGIMLIIGAKQKLTSWIFLLLVAFFLVLTGFTYLTGYVPNGVNFFQFGSWGEYNANNMKVTDCGCFGDFIKLLPKTSFFKDVALMIPAIYFVMRHKDMHELFNNKVKNAIISISTIALLFYCFSNFVWDLPKNDFRPFKIGTDVRAVREAEENAMAAVQITGWLLEHKETGESLTVPNADYMRDYTAKYKGVYKVVDQIKGEPAIESTKISEFEITDLRGNDITDDILYNDQPHFLIVNYMLKGDPSRETRIVKDSVFVMDTVVVASNDSDVLDTVVVRNFDQEVEREEHYISQNWKQSYIKTHIEKLKPFTDKAKNLGIPVLMAIGKSDPEAIMDFDKATGLAIDYGMADDILLKTIVRSNPGVVLWKDGKILDKWHINKLPKFEDVVEEHLR